MPFESLWVSWLSDHAKESIIFFKTQKVAVKAIYNTWIIII